VCCLLIGVSPYKCFTLSCTTATGWWPNCSYSNNNNNNNNNNKIILKHSKLALVLAFLPLLHLPSLLLVHHNSACIIVFSFDIMHIMHVLCCITGTPFTGHICFLVGIRSKYFPRNFILWLLRGKVLDWGTMLQAERSRFGISIRSSDVVNLHTPSSRTLALGLTLLKE
jgi:hypothetical protein